MNFSGINFGQMAAMAATAAGKGTERSSEDDATERRDKANLQARDMFKGKAVEQEKKPKGNEKSYLA